MTTDLDALRNSIEHSLDDHLPEHSSIAQPLVDAMRYASLGGGKRLRPMFLCAACSAVGGSIEEALPAACAVEYVHTYSLVHDDLPAMDDDDIRHGKPATHIEFGEANAILTGDALLTLAFELLARLPSVPPETRLQCITELTRAIGWSGMVGGQVLDMRLPDMDEKDVPLQLLRELHAAKSGALIRASILIGAMIGGADRATLEPLGRFADALGVAFQIRDDVLDVTASTEQLGKPAGSDLGENKHTFVRLLGVDGASTEADSTFSEAMKSLETLSLGNDWLHQLARFAVYRDY